MQSDISRPRTVALSLGAVPYQLADAVWHLRHPPRQEQPHRILLIKPDHLGDVLLTTPALQLLRQHMPSSHITMLVGAWAAPVVMNNHHINTLMPIAFPGFVRTHQASRISAYTTLWKYATLLRAGHFDLALMLRDDHWWGALLTAMARVPQRAGFAHPYTRPFLSHTLPWLPSEHVTLQALRLVASVCGLAPPHDMSSLVAQWPLHFEPSTDDVAWADSWLAHRRVPRTFLIIHPGTGGKAKLWLPDSWAAVADALYQQYEIPTVLTAGPGEESLIQLIATMMQSHTPALLMGEASIGQLAALLGRAEIVLGVDSGPLHLAVSQQTPTIHLYGPSDHLRFAPWGDSRRHVSIFEEIWCRPCSVFAACPRGLERPECMRMIRVDRVIEGCHRVLGNRGVVL